ncbi:MAG: hypothetical protein LUE22_03605, partial [Oscillospiraceae bacterium]|nr:hypothetical protein [Oscillospiraceae bacterium]
ITMDFLFQVSIFIMQSTKVLNSSNNNNNYTTHYRTLPEKYYVTLTHLPKQEKIVPCSGKYFLV